ncbi:SNTG1 (predicted) [Pycnogonum litorale]
MTQAKRGIVSIRDSKLLSDSETQNISGGNVLLLKPVRLELSGDVLKIQKEYAQNENISKTQKFSAADENGVVFPKERKVNIMRQKAGGLGLSIKGGSENKLPILISRIFKDQAADHTGQLFVGDAIIKVNNTVLDQCTHDDAVNILRVAGEQVTLLVRHYRPATPFLNKNLVKSKNNPSSSEESSSNQLQDENNWQSPRNSRESDQSWTSTSSEKKWIDVVSLNLILACVTRYIPGTDKRRPNAFEVKCRDGQSSGVVQCEDGVSLADWVKHISNNITQLTSQQITIWNKTFESHLQIVDMCWVSERTMSHQPWHRWKQKFVVVKGCNIYVLDNPPETVGDIGGCDRIFKVYQAMFRTLKESEHVDDRPFCFLLQTSLTTSIYFSTETKSELKRVESAWHKATYAAITRLASKTFSVVVKNKSAGLTLDWIMGFGLYDIEEKRYVWKYKFSQLKGSSDDSKSKLRLHFQDADTKRIETKELQCNNLQGLLYCMHAFLTAKVVSVDPNFLKSSS